MDTQTLKIVSYFLIPLAFVMAYMVFLVPEASAKIVIEGDRQFTDDINNCLNTYRDAPGVLGDAIKELENSDNEHKIINSPDWNNIINNVDDAFNGKGTGTVTRVDKEALEKYKKKLTSLANKDFCTAFLHEMWHAVDADRGEWSTDKTDGVKNNEVEAVMFQNFIHAIRGVPPRTTYGGVDISKHVTFGNDNMEEKPKEEAKPPAGGEETKKPEESNTSAPVVTKKNVVAIPTFKHVKPGEYSEVYVTVIAAQPGASVEATLSGPGVDGKAAQTVIADENCVAKFVWRIVSYGKYTVKGTTEGQSFSEDIDVK